MIADKNFFAKNDPPNYGQWISTPPPWEVCQWTSFENFPLQKLDKKLPSPLDRRWDARILWVENLQKNFFFATLERATMLVRGQRNFVNEHFALE